MSSFQSIKAVEWLGGKVKILDQTRLPGKEAYLKTSDYKDVITAIKELKVRGAPAIGVAAAYAIALGTLRIKAKSEGEFRRKIEAIAEEFTSSRPTAVNLPFAVKRMLKAAEKAKTIELLKEALVSEAIKIHAEEIEASESLSKLGSGLIKDGFTILTHCNTGSLAAPGYGTALGVIKYAFEQGKKIKVITTETRPLLQGARLTAWELKKSGIPFTLITDSMAGYFMAKGEISCVIVGADRIARNGDTANKIGTYYLAVLAKENKVPFYIAAPTTTIDRAIKSGDEIPIEERNPDEVTHIKGKLIAPKGTKASNPAFDVTPHRYITAIITESGIIRKPFGVGIKAL